MRREEIEEVEEVKEVKEKALRDAWASDDGLGWYDRMGVVPPLFWGKSAESVRGTGDRYATENERVRKCLKVRRTERRVSVERARRIGLTRKPVDPPPLGIADVRE
jgi:hypothetical protein